MKIGITAGEIITILEEENAPLTLIEIEMLVKASKNILLMSMGWLIRERLVHIEIVDNICFYTRRREENVQFRHQENRNNNHVVGNVLIFLVLIGLLCFSTSVWAGTITGTATWRVPEGQGNQNVVVYLKGVKGEFAPSEEPHLMDQQEMVFIPHVLPILKGEKVAFLNSDPFLHNVHAYLGRETLFNIAIMKSSKPKPRVKNFDQVGEHIILCDVHPEMEAWIIVLSNPYFAVTDENGSYTIENVPAGSYTLKTWHKKRKSSQSEVTVASSDTSKVDFTIKK